MMRFTAITRTNQSRELRARMHPLLAIAALLISAVAYGRIAVAGDLDKVELFNIPAQSLDKALLEFGLQAHIQIMFAWDPAIGSLRSHVLKGRFTGMQALSMLLEGTRLRYSVRGNTVTIAPDDPRSVNARDPIGAGSVDQDVDRVNGEARKSRGKEQHEVLEEVTVTGTYIRGAAPVGSPLIVYSHDEIAQSGAATIEDFARQIPENFSGADTLTSGLGQATQFSPLFDQTSDNIYGGSAFNLNGVGPSATLTLLNGHRLAPAGGGGSFVDVSLIPLSAVERIEILPDGASAIYGSDAVAGVVNIITRKHFGGAETSVSYSEATAGGAGEAIGSQLLGKSWTSGNAMMTYEYDRQAGLAASQRRFIPDQGGPDSILPPNWRNSVLISANQELGTKTSLSADGIYSTKRLHSEFTVIPTGEFDRYDTRDRTTQAGASVTLHRSLMRDWGVDVTGSYSRMEQTTTQRINYDFDSGFFVDDKSLISTDTRLGSLELLMQGSILDLPGGDLKAALGASFERQRFTQTASSSGTDNVTRPAVDARRNESSVYGELVIPLIGPANALGGAHALELSVAARADRYSGFGSTVNPKLGMEWTPVAGINLRASYGTSYRAPLLSQVAAPVISSAELFPDPGSDSGFTDTLYVVGGNPTLRPETSRSFSVGPDVELGDLSASVTYFHTRYVERVGTPPLTSILTVLVDPVDAPFVTRNPSLEVVDGAFNSVGFQGDYAGSGPSGVGAIFNSQYTNLAATTQSSVNLRIAYRDATPIGVWAPSIAVNRQIKNELQASPTSSGVTLLDLYGQPVRWKLHGAIAWLKGGYGATVTLNYVSGYHDPFTTPPAAISPWVTADLHLSYRVPDTMSSGVFSGVAVALNANNLTDEKPPYVAVPASVTGGAAPIPYDPANASPVGRLISLQVTKAWAQ